MWVLHQTSMPGDGLIAATWPGQSPHPAPSPAFGGRPPGRARKGIGRARKGIGCARKGVGHLT
jgi:hypothetical protein